MPISINSTLSTKVAIKPEKDELYKDELSKEYSSLKESENKTKAIQGKIRELRALESAAKGLEPAYIQTKDLVSIIEDLLLTKSPVSKVFNRHEQRDKKCKKWAERVIKHSIDKYDFDDAAHILRHGKNPGLLTMEHYKVLDIKDITKSDNIRAALTKLKKQLAIAETLQAKDNLLAAKDKAISDKDTEIARLNTELLRNKSEDWKQEAIKLKRLGVSVTDIGKQLGKGRTTISTYLNKPDVKFKLLVSTK